MTVRTEPIRGKVAKILSDRKVALNVGRQHNVQVGMLFDILVPGVDEIKDPDTGEVLGLTDQGKTKAQVKVVSVEDKFSLATTFRETRVNVGGAGIENFIPNLFEPPRWVTRVETIETREALDMRLTESERYVATGDPVVQVFEEV